MFYIEKNDKPIWLERKLSLLKVQDNTIILPLYENIQDKQIEKIANKTKRILNKFSNSKKVVISKEVQKQKIYINYLNSYGFQIQDGRWLFEVLLCDIVKYIIEKQMIKKVNISILINDVTDVELENIRILAKKYKTINVVTNHMEKFKKVEHELEEYEGIIITITNNKKKSLMNSNIIINVDFPEEIVNKYKIPENSTIINIKGKIKISQKRFNGFNVNNYEIDYRFDKKTMKSLNNKYYLRDLYESELYKKQRLNEIKEKLKMDKVVIKKLILNNGKM